LRVKTEIIYMKVPVHIEYNCPEAKRDAIRLARDLAVLAWGGGTGAQGQHCQYSAKSGRVTLIPKGLEG
jgi:hypothetical protein